MIPKEQTRIGEGGNCFATALASILETPIPEFGFGDDYWQRVRAYLSKRGLAYKRVPLSQRPQGYSTIEGISPRGGLHACVAKDGKFVHDPHPVSDDPRRGLAEPQYYGELMPLSNYRERLHRALDRAMDAAMDSQSNDPWRKCAACGQKTTRVLCPKCGERTNVEDGTAAMDAASDVIETYRGYKIQRGKSGAVSVVGLGNAQVRYFSGWSEQSAVKRAKEAVDKELGRAMDGMTAPAKDYQAEEFKVGERVKVWPAGGKKAWTGRVVKVGPGPELTIDNSAWNVPQRVPVSQVSKEQ